MKDTYSLSPPRLACLVLSLLISCPAFSFTDFGPEEFVQAGGVDVDVPGYSVPSAYDWNNDGLQDLIVGEGSGTYTPKVRVYLNAGTASTALFTNLFYAQSCGSDLTTPGSGCLGLFPHAVYWDTDGRKDLVIGQADGKIKIFLNTATDEEPAFDGGTFLQVGPTGSKSDIDVGSRATPSGVDWNSDGNIDLVVGAYDGKIRLFINAGTNGIPDFPAQTFAQDNSSNLSVPGGRSSPAVYDLNDDGKKDIIVGNTYGEALFYANTNTDASPSFSGYTALESSGVPIDLPGYARSRLFVCLWNDDIFADLLIGASDGKVHLYHGIPEPGALCVVVLATLLIRRGRFGTMFPIIRVLAEDAI